MTQTIKHSLVLVSTFAALSSGCLPKLDGLDAGVDDSGSGDGDGDENGDGDGDGDGALSCLIGTEIDAVGVTQSSWAPSCEVICDEGWGHEGTQLPIAWTTVVQPYPPDAHSDPTTLGLLENGRVVVAIIGDQRVGLRHFEPDGADIGGYDVEELGSSIYSVMIDSNVAYIVHSDHHETFELLAVGIGSQQPLWAKPFVGSFPSKVARGGDKLALVFTSELSNRELMVLDLDGEPLWSQPTVDPSHHVALSPTGDRLAVAGNHTLVYDADEGELLHEFAHGSDVNPWAVTFDGEDRVVTAGLRTGFTHLDAWLAVDELGGGSWERTYNRALLWCPDPEDNKVSNATYEWLTSITVLADGSLIAVGSEAYDQYGVVEGQPWVVRFSAAGEILGIDRGLWVGYGGGTVSAPDGSVYVLSTTGEDLAPDDPDLNVHGFTVRKYIP